MTDLAQPIRTIADLVELLQKENIPYRADEEGALVEVGTQIGPMILRWEKNHGISQFIYLLPFQVPVERLAAVESAILRVNHALALPGFGLDHANSYVYYRLVMPRRMPDNSLSVDDLQRLLRVTVGTTRDFTAALKAVAVEGKNPETILADARAGHAAQVGTMTVDKAAAPEAPEAKADTKADDPAT
jgi:hypothetical protein